MQFRLLFVVMLFSFVQKTIAQDVYDGQGFIDKGINLVEEEKYDEALKRYQMVDSLDPLYGQSLYEQAYAYYLSDSLDAALQLAREAKAKGHFEKLPSFYGLMGNIYSEQENFEKGLQIYEEGQAQYPDFGKLAFNKALMLYRAGNMQASLDEAFRAITINPYFVRAYYLAGVIALENGYVAEGSILLLNYLAANPSDALAPKAVVALNKRMSQHYLEENPLQFSKQGDDFAELEMILRNQFPLDEDFELVSDIDDVYPRHAQAVLDYLSTHQSKGGFIESYIAPGLADIFRKGHTEAFIYYTLSSLSGDVEKEISKKKKTIEKFVEGYITNGFWEKFAVRPKEHNGKVQDVLCFIENGYPSFRGPIKDGVRHGKWVSLNRVGTIVGTENYVDGVVQGKVKYFDEDGNLIEKLHAKDGVRHGKHVTFFSTGNKSSTAFYANGEFDKRATTYYIGGGKECEYNYVDGVLNGPLTCWHENGEKLSENTMKDGVYTGKRKFYYPDGQLEGVEYYADGKLNGESTYYHRNGEVQHTITYKDDEVDEDYISKDGLGRTNYKRELQGKDVAHSYYQAGMKTLELVSSMDGDENKSLTTYDYGRPVYKLVFDGDKIAEAIQYTLDNPDGVAKKGWEIALTDLYGNRLLVIRNAEDYPNRTETYYLANGMQKSKFQYQDGKQTGEAVINEEHGKVSARYFMKNDTLHGKYDLYTYTGSLSSSQNYKNGQLYGPYAHYYSNGMVSGKGFFLNDKDYGTYQRYTLDGNKISAEEYIDGKVAKLINYQRNGEVLNEHEVLEYNGDLQDYTYGGKIRVKCTYKNGKLEGQFTKLLGTDTLSSVSYLNGVRDGKVRYFNGFGVLKFEGYLNNGSFTYESKYYNELGGLKRKSVMYDDDFNGQNVLFSPSGKPYRSDFLQGGDLVGPMVYLSEAGDTLAVLHTFGEVIVGVDINKNGSLEKQPYSPKGKQEFTVLLDNGQKGLVLAIEDGQRTLFELYNEDGQPLVLVKRKGGLLEGKRSFFYSDGTLALEELFAGGEYAGVSKYYEEDGSLKYELTYQNDILHGPASEYSKGEKIKTVVYDSGHVVDVQNH